MNTQYQTISDIPENIRDKVEKVARLYREHISDESLDTIIRRYFGHFTSKKTFMLAVEMYPQSLVKYLNFDEIYDNYNKKNRFLFIDDATGFHVFAK